MSETLQEIITDENGAEIGLDQITILTNDACPNCIEELQLISSYYELPTDNDLEQTEIYAFYTDSLGNSPSIHDIISFEAIQYADDGSGWGDVGSISPENALVPRSNISNVIGKVLSKSLNSSNWLLFKRREVKLGRFFIYSGISPVSKLLLRLRLVKD